MDESERERVCVWIWLREKGKEYGRVFEKKRVRDRYR